MSLWFQLLALNILFLCRGECYVTILWRKLLPTIIRKNFQDILYHVEILIKNDNKYRAARTACGRARIYNNTILSVVGWHEPKPWNSPKMVCESLHTSRLKNWWGTGPRLKYLTTACTTLGSVFGRPCCEASSQIFLKMFWHRKDSNSISSYVMFLSLVAILKKENLQGSCDHVIPP